MRFIVMTAVAVAWALAVPLQARADDDTAGSVSACRLGASFLPPGLAAGPSAEAAPAGLVVDPPPGPQTAPPARVAVDYSNGYHVRAKIHKYASFATLPLFGAEAIVGQSLYNNPTQTKKSIHLGLAVGMGGLFALNSVTGVWNLVEARKDPHGRVRRLVHGILLLAADAGFLGAAMTGPHGVGRNGTRPASSASQRSLHRDLAFTSIGCTLTGYFVMIIGK